MREEVRSSGTVEPPLLVARSSSPPPTPAASSAGASSPAVQTNAGSIDWLGQGSKAGSVSCVASHLPKTSLSSSVGGSVLGLAQPLCRPWDRGDLLRRLDTFNPCNWSGKPKAAGSLTCARWGWLNVGTDTIECGSCGVQLNFNVQSSWTPAEVDRATEAFAKELDSGHKLSCPWRGNCCAESLVQFPPTPPSALIGGYKDRCDGLLQFQHLPVIAPSAIEHLKLTRGQQIDRLLSQSLSFTVGEFGFRTDNNFGLDSSREEAPCIYSHAQRVISLCGWEPRWLPNVQDCEEHSAQSARNACSSGPMADQVHPQDALNVKGHFSALAKKDTGKKKATAPDWRGHSRSPLLDCSLCGATVRIWDFVTVPRPARFGPSNIGTPEMSKKMGLVRGASAASGICGWIATDGLEKEQADMRDEAATADEGKSQSNVGVDLNLTMAGGFPSTQSGIPAVPEHFSDASLGRDLMIGQPAGSEVGDRAASYESHGPSSRKRSFEEGGSTVDRPLHDRLHQADSVEETVIDREGEEVNDNREYSCGPSKRARDADFFSSYHRDSSGAGPSCSQGIELDIYGSGLENLRQGHDYSGQPSTRESARASSVIAMDTVCHGDDADSMDSVENHPGDIDDVQLPSYSTHKNFDVNDASELNNSNQAQQSVCFQPDVVRVVGELGGSSTVDEEILNTGTAHARDIHSFGISGGSVGMGASHEAEIHGIDVSVYRGDSNVGDAEPVAEVTENVGQTGESVPDPGLMGEFAPEDMDREDPHGDSQDVMSRSVGKADSGSKIGGSAKAESVESDEKVNNVLGRENSPHPSLSYNAVICSAYEVSKEEVTQVGKTSLIDDCLVVDSEYAIPNGVTNGESNYEADLLDFEPIKTHNPFCPWVNGNVAAAGCSSGGSGSSSSSVALCGWQLTIDALDAFQSLGHMPIQTVESESAASLYKDDHFTPKRKLLTHHSVNSQH